MRILLLGGTGFIGGAVVEDLLAHGHEPVLFTRGRTGTALFPEVSRLTGDRDTGDLAALRHGEWDAVVDLSGYYPAQVGQAMDALGDRVGRYLFVSSHAVYDRANGPGGTEESPRREPLREADVLDDDTYGRLKVSCEDDVTTRFGDRATIVRPIKVVGPHDVRDAATYWVRRAARGGRVAVPGSPEQPVQFVDSRDLARLIVKLVEDDCGGAFHAVGPAEPTTLGGVLTACAKLAGTTTEPVAVPLDAVPRFFPLTRAPELWDTLRRDGTKAWDAGMPKTPLEETLRDLREWDDGRGWPPLPNGLSLEREGELLGGGPRSRTRLRRAAPTPPRQRQIHDVPVLRVLPDPLHHERAQHQRPNPVRACGVEREPRQQRPDALAPEGGVDLGVDECDALVVARVGQETRELAVQVRLVAPCLGRVGNHHVSHVTPRVSAAGVVPRGRRAVAAPPRVQPPTRRARRAIPRAAGSTG